MNASRRRSSSKGPANENRIVLLAVLSREEAVLRVKCPFLDATQIKGKACATLDIPVCCGEIQWRKIRWQLVRPRLDHILDDAKAKQFGASSTQAKSRGPHTPGRIFKAPRSPKTPLPFSKDKLLLRQSIAVNQELAAENSRRKRNMPSRLERPFQLCAENVLKTPHRTPGSPVQTTQTSKKRKLFRKTSCEEDILGNQELSMEFTMPVTPCLDADDHLDVYSLDSDQEDLHALRKKPVTLHILEQDEGVDSTSEGRCGRDARLDKARQMTRKLFRRSPARDSSLASIIAAKKPTPNPPETVNRLETPVKQRCKRLSLKKPASVVKHQLELENHTQRNVPVVEEDSAAEPTVVETCVPEERARDSSPMDVYSGETLICSTPKTFLERASPSRGKRLSEKVARNLGDPDKEPFSPPSPDVVRVWCDNSSPFSLKSRDVSCNTSMSHPLDESGQLQTPYLFIPPFEHEESTLVHGSSSTKAVPAPSSFKDGNPSLQQRGTLIDKMHVSCSGSEGDGGSCTVDSKDFENLPPGSGMNVITQQESARNGSNSRKMVSEKCQSGTISSVDVIPSSIVTPTIPSVDVIPSPIVTPTISSVDDIPSSVVTPTVPSVDVISSSIVTPMIPSVDVIPSSIVTATIPSVDVIPSSIVTPTIPSVDVIPSSFVTPPHNFKLGEVELPRRKNSPPESSCSGVLNMCVLSCSRALARGASSAFPEDPFIPMSREPRKVNKRLVSDTRASFSNLGHEELGCSWLGEDPQVENDHLNNAHLVLRTNEDVADPARHSGRDSVSTLVAKASVSAVASNLNQNPASPLPVQCLTNSAGTPPGRVPPSQELRLPRARAKSRCINRLGRVKRKVLGDCEKELPALVSPFVEYKFHYVSHEANHSNNLSRESADVSEKENEGPNLPTNMAHSQPNDSDNTGSLLSYSRPRENSEVENGFLNNARFVLRTSEEIADIESFSDPARHSGRGSAKDMSDEVCTPAANASLSTVAPELNQNPASPLPTQCLMKKTRSPKRALGRVPPSQKQRLSITRRTSRGMDLHLHENPRAEKARLPTNDSSKTESLLQPHLPSGEAEPLNEGARRRVLKLKASRCDLPVDLDGNHFTNDCSKTGSYIQPHLSSGAAEPFAAPAESLSRKDEAGPTPHSSARRLLFTSKASRCDLQVHLDENLLTNDSSRTGAFLQPHLSSGAAEPPAAPTESSSRKNEGAPSPHSSAKRAVLKPKASRCDSGVHLAENRLTNNFSKTRSFLQPHPSSGAAEPLAAPAEFLRRKNEGAPAPHSSALRAVLKPKESRCDLRVHLDGNLFTNNSGKTESFQQTHPSSCAAKPLAAPAESSSRKNEGAPSPHSSARRAVLKPKASRCDLGVHLDEIRLTNNSSMTRSFLQPHPSSGAAEPLAAPAESLQSKDEGAPAPHSSARSAVRKPKASRCDLGVHLDEIRLTNNSSKTRSFLQPYPSSGAAEPHAAPAESLSRKDKGAPAPHPSARRAVLKPKESRHELEGHFHQNVRVSATTGPCYRNAAAEENLEPDSAAVRRRGSEREPSSSGAGASASSRVRLDATPTKPASSCPTSRPVKFSTTRMILRAGLDGVDGLAGCMKYRPLPNLSKPQAGKAGIKMSIAPDEVVWKRSTRPSKHHASGADAVYDSVELQSVSPSYREKLLGQPKPQPGTYNDMFSLTDTSDTEVEDLPARVEEVLNSSSSSTERRNPHYLIFERGKVDSLLGSVRSSSRYSQSSGSCR